MYESASPQRPHKSHSLFSDGNWDIQVSQHRLRNFARYLDDNHDIASHALDILVNTTSQVYIEPMPQLEDGEPDEENDEILTDLWEEFQACPDTTGQLDFHTLCALYQRTLYRDGEIFVQHLVGDGGYKYKTEVPYVVELIEPDLCPYQETQPEKNIIHGILHNNWGQPLSYGFYKNHPHGLQYTPTNLKWVKAEKITHGKLIKRIRQVRGASVFANVFSRLDDIRDYENSERIAARIAASMTGYIKRNVPDFAPSNYTYPVNGAAEEFPIKPGMIFDRLRPGEEIGMVESNRPNPNIMDFRNGQLKAASGGLGVSYSALAKDYSGTYSSQRQEMVEQYQHYERLSRYFIFTFVRPFWRNFVKAAFAKGLVSGDIEKLQKAEFRIPPMPWIDPQKEADARLALMEKKLLSPQEIIRDYGRNPEETLHNFEIWPHETSEPTPFGPDGLDPEGARPPGVPGGKPAVPAPNGKPAPGNRPPGAGGNPSGKPSKLRR